MSGERINEKMWAPRCLLVTLFCVGTALLFTQVAFAQVSVPTLLQAPPVYGGAVNTIPNGVAMGDFNGDGLLDFAVIEYNPNVATDGQIEIYRGNPDGSFTVGSVYPVGTLVGQPFVSNHIIATGHFNGPNQPLGIAVGVNQAAGCTSGGVVFLFGNGDGTFQSPSCLPNANAITSIAVADYNNDGFDDVAVGNVSGTAAGSMTVYFNHGIVNFGPVANSFYNYGGFSAVIPGLGGATLYGTIVVGQNSLRPGDGTSIALLASTGPFSQYVAVFENILEEVNGGPPFINFYPSSYPLAISGNGLADIAWTNISPTGPTSLVGIGSTGGISEIPIAFPVGIGNSLGPLTPLQNNAPGLALLAADFDGNGTPDLAYLDNNLNLNIVLNPGTASSSLSGPFGQAGHGIAAGLSNGLNKWVLVDSGAYVQFNPAFAQLEEARFIAVYLLDPTTGKPSLAPLYRQSPLYTTGAPRSFAVGDFDGDGLPDVAVLGEDEINFNATISVFHNAYKTDTPPGYVTPPTVISLTNLLGLGGGSLGAYGIAPGYSLVAGSFRNFDPDIAMVTPGGVTLLENQGLNAQGQFTFTLDPNCQGYFLSSLSGPAPSQTNCYLAGDSHFPTLSTVAGAPRPPIIAADMNGHGYQDIVVAIPENCYAATKSAIYVLLSNGDGTFQSPIYIPSPVVNPVGLAAAKLLGNPLPDLVVANGGETCSGTQAETGAVTFVGAAIIPNTGNGTFGAPQTIYSQASDVLSPSVSAVAVADMNKDGAPDVVISANDGLHVLLNTPGRLGIFADQGAVPLFAPADLLTNASQIDIADLNNDGVPDVAAAIGGIVYIFAGDGNGNLYSPVQSFASGPNSNQIRALDVNGDGVPDVLVNGPPGFSVLLNGASASAQPLAFFSATSISLGGALVGSSLPTLLTLGNTGNAPLNLAEYPFASNTGNEFEGTTLTCSYTANPSLPLIIPPGSSCTFGLLFTAFGSGPASAQIYFYDNAATSNAPTQTTGDNVSAYFQTITLSAAGIAPAPIITSITPNSGPMAGGESVVIAGKNFQSGATVLFGTVPATSVTFTSSTSLSVVVPGLSAGLVNVTVTNPDGQFTVDLGAFTITAPPPPPPTVTITVTETINVSDAPALPDVFASEQIHVSDQVFVTPLLSNFAPPAAAFSDSSLGFHGTSGSTQTLTLQNVGGAPIVFSGAPVTSSGFTITQTVCSDRDFPSTLAIGGECVFTITYSGSSPTGTIVFTDNAALSSPASAGVSPKYTQTILLNGAASTAVAIGPPSATVTIPTITEAITITDAIPSTPQQQFITLIFNPGTNVTGMATFDCPSNPAPSPANPCTDPNAYAVQLTIPQVLQTITLTVQATEVPPSLANGTCPPGATPAQNFSCRFSSFFNYGTQANGSTVPLCNPFANGNCVNFLVYSGIPGVEPNPTSYVGPIDWAVSWNNDQFVPPAPYAGSLPQLYDDPDYAVNATSPFGTNCNTPMLIGNPPVPTSPAVYCQYVFNITTSYDPAKKVDAQITGRTLQFNDVVVAFPPANVGNLTVNTTPSSQTVTAGSPLNLAISITNSGGGAIAGATLSDPLPAGTNISWTISPTYSGPGSCSITGAIGSQSLNCSFATINASQSFTISLASASSSTGNFTNTAVVQIGNQQILSIGAITVQPAQASFSGLMASQAIYIGKASITLGGNIRSGTSYPAVGETVSILINGVTANATIGANGAFSTSFPTATIPVATLPSSKTYAPYTITYSYAGDTTFSAITNSSTTLTVKITGDVNGDGVVTCADIAIIKAAFGTKTGQASFNPLADINGDGVVNVLDLATVARQLPAGTSCP